MTKNKKNKKTDKEIMEEELDEENLDEEELIEEDSDENENDLEEELNVPMDRRLFETEKKINAILIIVVILMLLSFVSLVMTVNKYSSSTNSNNTTNTTSGSSSSSTSSYDTSAFISISATQLESLSKDNTIVVMLGRQGCSYCAAFAPILTSVVSEYGITAYYIDITEIIDISAGTVIDEDALNAIANLGGSGDWESFAAENFGGTPETLVIRDNEVINGLNQYTDAATVRTMLEEAGFKAQS